MFSSLTARLLATAALLLSAAACGSSSQALPAGPRIVDVGMREYAFDYTPPTRGGRVVFNIRNAGEVQHEVDFLQLPDEVQSIDAQLKGSVRRVLPTVASLIRDPGTAGSLALDLPRGRYALVCFIRDPDKVIHGVKGMNAQFEIP